VQSVDANAASWIAAHAAAGPERCAVADADRRLGYAELHERIQRCAAVLAAAGTTRGDRVALVLGNRTPYLEVVFAAAQLGAIAVPVNARLTAHEIRHVFDDCTPKALVTDVEHRIAVDATCELAESPPRFQLTCGGAPDAYEEALAGITPLTAIEPVSPDDAMILMYTSGTTGRPKGALLPARKTLFNCLNAERFFGLTPQDRVLVMLPLFHSFGLAILAIPALHAGARVILQPRFDPDAVWRAVDAERISFFGGVPTMFRRLLDALASARDGGCDLASLRFLFTAGSAVPVELIRDFERRGLVLKQGYGQTETSILCCLDARDALRKAGSVGRPVHHAELRVVRHAEIDGDPATWQDVAVGETGEIVVRGPITMLGYWQRPEESAATLRGDWLRTHDLATLDAEGFLTLVGRRGDMYISGGENVYPAEVEAVYEEHPAIREIAVVGVPDERWGEAGRAYVVSAEGAPLDGEALLGWGRERLASFKLPREFVAVARLPRTVTGKVQKHRLGAP
jgi:fatty-acyl-CoA synthase